MNWMEAIMPGSTAAMIARDNVKHQYDTLENTWSILPEVTKPGAAPESVSKDTTPSAIATIPSAPLTSPDVPATSDAEAVEYSTVTVLNDVQHSSPIIIPSSVARDSLIYENVEEFYPDSARSGNEIKNFPPPLPERNTGMRMRSKPLDFKSRRTPYSYVYTMDTKATPTRAPSTSIEFEASQLKILIEMYELLSRMAAVCDKPLQIQTPPPQWLNDEFEFRHSVSKFNQSASSEYPSSKKPPPLVSCSDADGPGSDVHMKSYSVVSAHEASTSRTSSIQKQCLEVTSKSACGHEDAEVRSRLGELTIMYSCALHFYNILSDRILGMGYQVWNRISLLS